MSSCGGAEFLNGYAVPPEGPNSFAVVARWLGSPKISHAKPGRRNAQAAEILLLYLYYRESACRSIAQSWPSWPAQVDPQRWRTCCKR